LTAAIQRPQIVKVRPQKSRPANHFDSKDVATRITGDHPGMLEHSSRYRPKIGDIEVMLDSAFISPSFQKLD
jgi:hypothetical protein